MWCGEHKRMCCVGLCVSEGGWQFCRVLEGWAWGVIELSESRSYRICNTLMGKHAANRIASNRVLALRYH